MVLKQLLRIAEFIVQVLHIDLKCVVRVINPQAKIAMLCKNIHNLSAMCIRFDALLNILFIFCSCDVILHKHNPAAERTLHLLIAFASPTQAGEDERYAGLSWVYFVFLVYSFHHLWLVVIGEMLVEFS